VGMELKCVRTGGDGTEIPSSWSAGLYST